MMPACPGQWGVSGVMKVHCPHCRDAAPPVLTEEDKQTLESAETALAFAHGAIHEVVNHQSVRPDFLRNAMKILKRDREALRQLRDRLTGGEGGSPI